MRRLLSLFIALAVFVTACTKPEPDNPQPNPETPKQESVTLSPSTNAAPVIATEGGSTSVSFTASTSWSASIINTKADSWCSVVPTSGVAGSASITITAKENTTPDNRSASVVIKAGTATQTIKVEQKQKDALTVTASSFEISADGGEIKVATKSNVSFTHSISTDAQSWIKAVQTKALKDSTLTFEIAANDGKDGRTGKIYLSSGTLKDTVNVYQEGDYPRIAITQKEYVLKSEGESFEVEVASNVNATMSMVFPHGVEAWITENTTRAVSTNKFYFTAQANETYDSRSALLIFANAENNLADTVTVIQAQKDAIVLAKSEYEFGLKGGNLDFEIQTNVDVTVTIPDSCSAWIKQVETRGVETKKLYFDILPADSVSREGKIVLTGGAITQTVKVIQRSETVKIDPTTVPANEVWYVTSNGRNGYISNYKDFPSNTSVVEQVYEKGKWIIRFNAALTYLNLREFNLEGTSEVTGLYLPNTVEEFSTYSNHFHFKEMYVPENIKKIRVSGSLVDNLERFYGNNVSEDGRCIIVDGKVLSFAASGIEEYTFPTSATIIGEHAVSSKELKNVIIPEGVHTLELSAFNSPNIEYITLPASLQNYGGYAFNELGNLKKISGACKFISNDGYSVLVDNYNNLGMKYLVLFASGAGLSSYEIPEGTQAIESYAFCNAESLREVTFPASLTTFSSGNVFYNTNNIEKIYGQRVSDDNRSYVVDSVLIYVAPKGLKDYTTPADVTKLGYGVFNNMTGLESVVISDHVLTVGSAISCRPYEIPLGYIMHGCRNLKSVTISANMRILGMDPFGSCEGDNASQLDTVYLRASIPPVLGHNFPELIPTLFGDMVIYVPEESLAAYMSSPDWIPYRNYIKGYKYTDLPKNDTYISKDYSMDSTVVVLQQATEGKGIDIVLMGDAYSDRQVTDGTYKADMEAIYNNLFTEEPYKSYKQMFNVYYVNVVSATEGYDYGNTALDGYFGDGTRVGGNDNVVFQYALKAISEEEMDEALLVVAMNSDNYAGTCYMYNPQNSGSDYGTGVSVSYFPKGGDAETFAQLLHHEACGHGFAKLADEYAYEDLGAVSSVYEAQIKEQQVNWGWWKNVDFTSDSTQVRWAKFLADSRYANDGLGTFEGGLTYWSGVWRPTENSIMRYNTGGFNAPSREAIYYRIHKLAYGAEWEYDYEKFVEYDVVNRKTSSSVSTKSPSVVQYRPLHPPVVHNKSWRDVKNEN